MDGKDIAENFTHASIVGGTGFACSFALVGMDDQFLGMPAPISLAVTMAGASLVSKTLEDTVYESLPENESDLLYSSTAPVLTGLGATGLAYMVLGKHLSTASTLQFFALGAISEIGGGYIDENILGPALNLN